VAWRFINALTVAAYVVERIVFDGSFERAVEIQGQSLTPKCGCFTRHCHTIACKPPAKGFVDACVSSVSFLRFWWTFNQVFEM
jgi:hypothetical protein